MFLLFLNSAMLIIGLGLFILHLKTKHTVNVVWAVLIILFTSFSLGGIVHEYGLLNKLVKEEIVERVYDSQTGESHYIIRNGVIGFDQSFKKLEEYVDKEDE